MSIRRAGWAAGGVALAVVLGALAWGVLHPARAGTGSLVGQDAPETVVRTLDGRDVSLRALRGSPVVLNFWASWCQSCRQEEGVLRQAALETSGRVHFLGVDIQDSEREARDYASRAAIPYPLGPARVGGSAAFGVTAPPETFFIDSGGRVLGHVSGPLDSVTLGQYLKRIAA